MAGRLPAPQATSPPGVPYLQECILASLDASGAAARDPREIVLRSPMSSAQRLAVALCCAMLAIDGYDLVAVTFALPGIGAEWGTSKAMLGALFSIGDRKSVVSGKACVSTCRTRGRPYH